MFLQLRQARKQGRSIQPTSTGTNCLQGVTWHRVGTYREESRTLFFKKKILLINISIEKSWITCSNNVFEALAGRIRLVWFIRRENKTNQPPWPQGNSHADSSRMPVERPETPHDRVSICVRTVRGSDISFSLSNLPTWCPAPDSVLFPLSWTLFLIFVYFLSNILFKVPISEGHSSAGLPKVASHASNLLHSLSPYPDLFFFFAPFTTWDNTGYLFISSASLTTTMEALGGHRLSLVSFTAVSQHPEQCLAYCNHSLNVWEMDEWMPNKESLLFYCFLRECVYMWL